MMCFSQKNQRRAVYILIGTIIWGMLFFGMSETVSALQTVPQNITTTFGNDATTAYNFNWITSPASPEGVVEYCSKDRFRGFDQDNIETAKARSYETTTDADTRVVHKVELQGLEPGTDYIYRVGTPGNFSAQAAFRTAGNEPSGFTFINITDTQGANSRDYALWKNILDQALVKFPKTRFLVHTGDLVDDGQKISQWDLFTGAAADELMNLPIAPSLGNHDVLNKNGTNAIAKNFTDSFTTPREMNAGAPVGTVYSFDYGNTHIAVMNTECGSENYKKQADWLRADMAGSSKLWKIVALHRGPYGATYDSSAIRKAWTPVFDDLGIDLVLQGHDHNYVRSYSMINGAKVNNGEGTLYLTGNSGGVKFYPSKPRMWQQVDLQPKRQMYIAVTVNQGRMLIQAYDDGNTLRDSTSLDKLVLFFNDQEIRSDAQSYINEDNRTMVPLRLISERLGADVAWNDTDRSVTIIKKEDKIQMTVGSRSVKLNGEVLTIDTEPTLIDGRTMVPLRFITENLGATAEFDLPLYSVYINSR